MGRGDAPTLEVVDEYDADGDGRVTREEYLAGFLRDGIRPVRKSNARGATRTVAQHGLRLTDWFARRHRPDGRLFTHAQNCMGEVRKTK